MDVPRKVILCLRPIRMDQFDRGRLTVVLRCEYTGLLRGAEIGAELESSVDDLPRPSPPSLIHCRTPTTRLAHAFADRSCEAARLSRTVVFKIRWGGLAHMMSPSGQKCNRPCPNAQAQRHRTNGLSVSAKCILRPRNRPIRRLAPAPAAPYQACYQNAAHSRCEQVASENILRL